MDNTNDNSSSAMNNYSNVSVLILNIKAHSMPYVIKTIVYMAIIAIIFLFSGDFNSKILSALTYMASISLEVYFIGKQYIKNRKIEVYCFIHAVIIWFGTAIIFITLLLSFSDQDFQNSNICSIVNVVSNVLILYATVTPAIEIFIHCDDRNQFNNESEKES